MVHQARKLRILLLFAPYPRGTLIISRQVPLGVGYLAAVLRADHFEIKIADLALKYDKTALLRLLVEYSPDVVGISCMTQNHKRAYELARTVKRALSESIVILGGVHATFMPREVLSDAPEIDIVVIGEGEYTMLDLCRRLEQGGPAAPLDGIPGIAYRDSGAIRITETRERITELDDLPYPAFDLIVMPELDEYFTKGRGLPILTSRGCPFQCAFCSTSVMHGKKYRTRSPKKIVDEIEHEIRTFGIKSTYIVDDIFTLDNERAKTICFEIIQRNLDIAWGCSARVDSVTPQLLRIMRKAGCQTIFLGIESLDDRVLRRIQKGFTALAVRRAVKWILDEGIIVDASFILGLPGENPGAARKIRRFVKDYRINGRVLTNSLQILPGTDIYCHPDKYGIKLSDRYRSDWYRPRSFTKGLTGAELLKHKIRIQVASFEVNHENCLLHEIPTSEIEIDSDELLRLVTEPGASARIGRQD